MRFNANKYAGLVMVLFFATFVVLALGFNKQARLMPLIVGIPGLLLSIFQLYKDLCRGASEAVVSMSHQELVLAAWLVGSIVVIILSGFAWGAPFMIAIYFHFILREKPMFTIASAVGCFVVLEIVLNRFLHAQLFEGFLPPYFNRIWM